MAKKRLRDRKKRIKAQRENEYLFNNTYRKKIGLPEIKKFGGVTQTQAPDNFSFINNPQELLVYFQEQEKLLSRKYTVRFDLSSIKTLTPDAITLLIAKVDDPSFRGGGRIEGNAPKKSDLKRMFIESGFYEFVNSEVPKEENGKNLLLHKRTKNKVENTIAKEISEMAVQHTFQGNEKFTPIYRIIIECMANTYNHAGMEEEGLYDWWIFTYNNPETLVTSFCFLDLGVGIFQSLRGRFGNLLSKLGISKNNDLLRDLFGGKFFTRTNEPNRGKGLPTIYKLSNNAQIKNFILISNDVYANIKTGEYNEMPNDFRGTLLYWELHPINKIINSND